MSFEVEFDGRDIPLDRPAPGMAMSLEIGRHKVGQIPKSNAVSRARDHGEQSVAHEVILSGVNTSLGLRLVYVFD